VAEASSGSGVQQIAERFGVDWPHLLSQVVSFAIVCWLLQRFAYKPILKLLDERRKQIAEGIAESMWMTVVSTVVGIALSIPVGIGAAKNIAPAPVYYFCRAVLAVSRSFQEIILAIFFVKLFGFGPFAGVVTLSFATIGFYGKLLAEDIEDMDASQAEAVRAAGASWLQWLNYGVQPQVMPRMIGLGLYRFDINFRESAVIGIVGGGGIGATLNTAFDRYEFDSAAAIIIVIIVIVMACEYGSGYLRRWVQ